jgi:hypothetical protein
MKPRAPQQDSRFRHSGVLNHSKYSDLTAAQFEGLGKLFVEWSNMEFLLGLLLSRLLFTPEFLGRTYSDEMNAARLESAINNALDIHKVRYHHAVVSEEQIAIIRGLLKDVSRCRTLRNKFAHFLWMRSSDDEIVGHKMSGKLPAKKKDRDSLQITLAELTKAHAASYSLVEKLSKIVLEIPSVAEKRNRHLGGSEAH